MRRSKGARRQTLICGANRRSHPKLRDQHQGVGLSDLTAIIYPFTSWLWYPKLFRDLPSLPLLPSSCRKVSRLSSLPINYFPYDFCTRRRFPIEVTSQFVVTEAPHAFINDELTNQLIPRGKGARIPRFSSRYETESRIDALNARGSFVITGRGINPTCDIARCCLSAKIHRQRSVPCSHCTPTSSFRPASPALYCNKCTFAIWVYYQRPVGPFCATFPALRVHVRASAVSTRRFRSTGASGLLFSSVIVVSPIHWLQFTR